MHSTFPSLNILNKTNVKFIILSFYVSVFDPKQSVGIFTFGCVRVQLVTHIGYSMRFTQLRKLQQNTRKQQQKAEI